VAGPVVKNAILGVILGFWLAEPEKYKIKTTPHKNG
jgi:hypothetical protein